MVDCMESTAQYIKRHSDFLRENIKDDTLSDFLTEAVLEARNFKEDSPRDVLTAGCLVDEMIKSYMKSYKIEAEA